MAALNVYLNFNGNCEEAFLFYKSVFGGEFLYVGRIKDMPPQEGMPPIPPDQGDKLMHISLMTGAGSTLMGCDVVGGWAQDYKPGNNFALSLNAESMEDADRLFAALSAGGKTTMPMAQTFWGSYFGMLTDKFGIAWMVSFETEKTPEA